MDVEQLSIKFYARDRGGFDPAGLIPVFHRWVRERVLPGELLIDVADYRHVPDGPGVMVVGDQCHFGVDSGGRQLGFAYSRRRDQPGEASQKLRQVFHDATRLALLLEGEASIPLELFPGAFDVRVLSRRVARNTPEAFTMFEQTLQAVVNELYEAAPARITHLTDVRQPLTARIQVADPPPLRSIVGRLSA